MSKSKVPAKLVPFDAARYLTDDTAVAEYVTAVLEAGNPDLLLLALGDFDDLMRRARRDARKAGMKPADVRRAVAKARAAR